MQYTRMLLWSAHERFVVLGLSMFELVRGVDADLFAEFPEPLAAPNALSTRQRQRQKTRFDAKLAGKSAALIVFDRCGRPSRRGSDRAGFTPGKIILCSAMSSTRARSTKTRLLNHAHFTF